MTFPQGQKNPRTPECTHAMVDPLPAQILLFSVHLSVFCVSQWNRHCYAFQMVTSCKIKHMQHKNSSPWGCREQQNLEAKAQVLKMGLDKISDYQTSHCPLERNAPMPGPFLVQEYHCSPTSVNKPHANILITFASTWEQLCEYQESQNQTSCHEKSSFLVPMSKSAKTHLISILGNT